MDTQFLLPNQRQLPLTIQSGDGCYVFDTSGRRFLDLASGLGVNALGYNHPRITAAIVEQARLCIHTSNLYLNCYQAPLARRLCALAGLDRALFTNSGTESTEAALKLARCYGRARGEAKTQLVALRGSFHGRTRGALAVGGQEWLRGPFAPYAAEVSFVAPDDEPALAAAVTGRTAAVILEPVMGEGGIRPLAHGFLRSAREAALCHDALLIADECQCGLGRTGAAFAFEWAGIQPDIVTVAKPLAGGLPLGAVLFNERVARTFPDGAHATTFGGGPLACRVALEFLSEMEDLLPRIRNVGERLRAGLLDLQSRHEAIREVRGAGLMLAMELDVPGRPYVLRALERGLLINCTQENVLRLLPPFILTDQQADEALGILDAIFEG